MPAHSNEILNRARSIEGHVSAVVRMLEQDTYCIDIIRQSQAVQRALDRLNAQLLQQHLHTCVTTAILADDRRERERVIQELMSVFETKARL